MKRTLLASAAALAIAYAAGAFAQSDDNINKLGNMRSIPDSSILVSDDLAGAVYRISYGM